MPEKKQYFHILSAIRGIAAILVAIRHTLAFWTFTFPMSFMAVDIFFLLSGVVLEASYRNRLLLGLTPWHFMWIRLCRIYPLYMVGTFITVIVLVFAPHHQLLNGADHYPISHKFVSFILTGFMLPNLMRSEVAEFPFDHPTWSLFFEISVNFLYAFIAMSLTTKRAILITLACGIGLLGSLFFYHHVELGWMRTTIPGGVFRIGFSFFLGVLLYRAKVTYGANLEFLRRNSGVLQWIVFASTLFLLVAPVPEHLRRVVYIASVYAFFPLIIFMALFLEPKKTRKLWGFLGDASYPVYTLQVPLYFLFCTIIFPAIGISVGAVSAWFGYVFLAGLVILAYLIDRFFDRPSQRVLRSLWKEQKALDASASGKP